MECRLCLWAARPRFEFVTFLAAGSCAQLIQTPKFSSSEAVYKYNREKIYILPCQLSREGWIFFPDSEKSTGTHLHLLSGLAGAKY
jgi:hypothetical protein